jgi:hypothetical protein
VLRGAAALLEGYPPHPRARAPPRFVSRTNGPAQTRVVRFFFGMPSGQWDMFFLCLLPESLSLNLVISRFGGQLVIVAILP